MAKEQLIALYATEHAMTIVLLKRVIKEIVWLWILKEIACIVNLNVVIIFM
jgi:hypothetical protein